MATSVAWRDLTLTAATGYKIAKIEGWESRPAARYDKQSRARGHGSHSSPVWADERLVTVTGEAHSRTDRDQLLADLDRRFGFDGGEEPLTITLGGRTLTAQAQLLRYDPVIATGSFNVGQIQWVAQWRCPDPLRYGDLRSAATGLPTSGGGLVYPLTYPLEYGPLGETGQVVLDNEGTADAPIEFAVTGGLPAGFEISAAGGRLTYAAPVPAGQAISIDTATGTVLAEGTADRRSELTYADWLQVPAGTALTVQFTSLGGAYDPSARLAALWRPANW